MILPIVAYGNPVLNKKAVPVTPEYPGLKELISNMFETMYSAQGVGLAAPQIGKSIRLFVIDASPFADDEEDEEAQTLKDFKEVFINAQIEDESGEEWGFEEGCLSIPTLREEVYREETIRIRYFDAHFNEHVREFSGYAARIIQHEYDHIEGKLFTDRLSPLKRKMLRGKLNDISKGKVDVNYKMKFNP